MPRSSLLYTHPPEASELTKPPLQAPTQGLQVVLANLRGLWIFVRVGQGYRDESSLEGLERSSVDASQTEQEVPSACLGETPYLISGASSETLTKPEPVTCLGILEGECGYRPSDGRGDVGNLLM